MPELPEVETVKRTLENFILNKKIKDIEVIYPRIIEDDVEVFKQRVVNKTFLKIEPILRKTDGFFAFMHALSKDEEIPQYYRPMNLDCYSY